MDLGRTGIWSHELRLAGSGQGEGREVIREVVGELEQWGFKTVWLPGLDGSRILEDVQAVLGASRDLVVATGVTSIWALPAVQLAAEHARLQAAYGGRFLLGLGISSAETARRAGQGTFQPLHDMGAYLYSLDVAHPQVAAGNRVLAAQGPRMSLLAAQRSLGLHPFLVDVDYCHITRALLGPVPVLAPYLPVVLASDPELARSALRDWVARFLPAPSYQSSLRRQGFTETDLASGGSDRLLDAISAWGDLDTIAARVRAYREAGADHVALHVLGATAAFPRAQWRELAAVMT